MGKPRMTQRDQWATRDCVVRYRQYCDAIRAASGNPPDNPWCVEVVAYISMPSSWSKKKKEATRGKVHRQKPDWDNIGKAVCDALMVDDSILASGMVTKFWCDEDEAKTVIALGHG